jgi:hypothetical protein
MVDTLNPILAAHDRRPTPAEPQMPPQAQRMSGAQIRAGTPAALRTGIVIALGLLIFFPRFQLNIGPYFVNVGLIAQFLIIGILLAKNSLRVDPVRGALYTVSIAIMFVAWIWSPAVSSYLSAMLVAAAYLAFIFVARLPDGNESLQRFIMVTFSNLMMIAAVAGILQFFVQFVYKPSWLFDFTSYIPLLVRGSGTYNTVISTGGFLKTNGFFFREPSTCSQYLALALICEIAMQRRKLKKLSLIRMATLGFCLLLTYSGTGLITLFVGLMFPLGLKTALRIGGLGLGALVIFFVLGNALNLGFTANRINEFSAPGTSAYARYVAPWNFIEAQMDSHSITFVIGHGPGSVTRNVSHRAMYENADPTWAKALFEYGVLGFVTFVLLIFYATLKSQAPAELIAAFNFGWLIIWGGVFLAPEMTALIFIMSAVASAGGRTTGRQRSRVVIDVGQLSMPSQRR